MHPSEFIAHATAAQRARQLAERQAIALEAIARKLPEPPGPGAPDPAKITPAPPAAPTSRSGGPVRIADLPDTLDVKQAALVLGLKPQTIYDWVAKKRLPCLRAGRAVRFDKAALLEFRQNQVAKPEARDIVSINLMRPRRARSA
ncbi:MAG TPA: helix-turn-helix domain-containing protein [Planctomycetota bacterium]|nr:helix-turn-helix domain-containing protein [Planctomycetota bacterium]